MRQKDWAQQRYEGHVNRIAEGLRSLADRVERTGHSPRPGRSNTYSTAACDVLHDVTWGVANLNLDNLLNAALDADDTGRQVLARVGPVP
jgi:hypothetical protein